MNTFSLVVAVFALSASQVALAADPAKPPLKLSDLTPKYTPSADNDLSRMRPPPPPPPPSYPTIKQAPNGEPRAYLSKDVSVSGTLQPPSLNVQVPIPEGNSK